MGDVSLDPHEYFHKRLFPFYFSSILQTPHTSPRSIMGKENLGEQNEPMRPGSWSGQGSSYFLDDDGVVEFLVVPKLITNTIEWMTLVAATKNPLLNSFLSGLWPITPAWAPQTDCFRGRAPK